MRGSAGSRRRGCSPSTASSDNCHMRAKCAAGRTPRPRPMGRGGEHTCGIAPQAVEVGGRGDRCVMDVGRCLFQCQRQAARVRRRDVQAHLVGSSPGLMTCISKSSAASGGSRASGKGRATRCQPVARRLVIRCRPPTSGPSTDSRLRGESASSRTSSQPHALAASRQPTRQPRCWSSRPVAYGSSRAASSASPLVTLTGESALIHHTGLYRSRLRCAKCRASVLLPVPPRPWTTGGDAAARGSSPCPVLLGRLAVHENRVAWSGQVVQSRCCRDPAGVRTASAAGESSGRRSRPLAGADHAGVDADRDRAGIELFRVRRLRSSSPVLALSVCAGWPGGRRIVPALLPTLAPGWCQNPLRLRPWPQAGSVVPVLDRALARFPSGGERNVAHPQRRLQRARFPPGPAGHHLHWLPPHGRYRRPSWPA